MADNAAQHADDVATTGSEWDLDYWAWTIIANVSEGCWEKQTEEWQEAAAKWRDAFHASLAAARNDGTDRD